MSNSSAGRDKTQSSQLHVSIENAENKEGKSEASLRISGRPPTHMGAQGDHASAYYLIQNVAHAIIAKKNLAEATLSAFSLLDRLQAKFEADITMLQEKISANNALNIITPEIYLQQVTELIARSHEFTALIDQTKEKIGKQQSNNSDEQSLENILKGLFELAKNNQPFKNTYLNKDYTLEDAQEETLKKLATATEVVKTKQLEKDIISIIKGYLTIRNKLPYTAFPTEGNLPPPPGEGSRIKTAANQLKVLAEVLEEQKDSNGIDHTDYAQKISRQMFELFWYPKIPKKKLITMDKWDAIKGSYNKGTKPRDNDLETLYEVTANHIDLVFTCYPEFTNPREFTNQIVENFVALVASKGTIKNVTANWGMPKDEYETFVRKVINKLVLGYGREELDESASQSRSTNSTKITPTNTTPPDSTMLTSTPSGTVDIHQMLNMPITPPQPSLTHLILAQASTPLTTASDTSYSDEFSKTPNSQNKEQEVTEKRTTRSQESKSFNEQLEQTLEHAKKLGKFKGNSS